MTPLKLTKTFLGLVIFLSLFGVGQTALAIPVTYSLNVNDTAYPAMYPNDQTGTFNLFFEREWDAAAYQSIPYVKDVSVDVTYDMSVSIYPSGPVLSGGESLPVGTELQLTPLHGAISSSQFINGNGGGWTNSEGVWYPNADFPDGPTGSMLWHFSGGGDPYYQGRTSQCSPQYDTNGWFYMMFSVNPTSPIISNSGTAGLMNLGSNRYRITSPGTLDLIAEFPATYGRFYHEISATDRDLTPGCLTSWDVLPAFPVTVTNMGDTDFDGFDDFSWGEDRGNPVTLTVPSQQVILSFNATALPAPILTITNDPVAYGTIIVGGPGTPQTINIRNTGTADFNGTLYFPGGGIYTCAGGNTVSVPATGLVYPKTCTLSAPISEPLGGLAQVTDGAYTKTFTTTATTGTLPDMDIWDVANTQAVSGSPYPISMGVSGFVSSGASPLYYDFEVRNGGSSVMDFTVSILGGATPGYSIAPAPGPNGGCSGSGLSGAMVRICRITFTPSDAPAGGSSATVRFDNTSAGGTVAPDPIDITFSATVQSGSVGGIASSGPIPMTGPVGNDYTLNFGPRPISPPGAPVNQVIGIYNGGDQTLNGTYTNVSGPNFTTSGSGSFSIPPSGAPHLITVTFTPQTTVVPDVVITIDADAANFAPTGNMTLTLSGSGSASPSLLVTPQGQGNSPWASGSAFMTFNAQEVYLGPTESRIVTVDNTFGSAPTTINISSDDTEFTVSTNSLTVPAGASRTFTITFDPSAPVVPFDTRSGIITLDANNIGADFIITVQGDAEVNAPSISVNPTPLGFGRVIIGKTKDMIVTVQSTDSRTMSFGAVGVVLGDPAFTCVSTNCTTPFTMDSGDVEEFTVRFTPSSIGNYTGSMIIPITTPSIPALPPVPISGTGARPVIKYEEN